MAAAGGGSLSDTFKKFATKADGKEATTADINKWCKDAGVVGKNCNSNHIDISFAKCKAKTSKNITFGEMEALIAEMAKKYKDDHKGLDEAGAAEQIKEKLSKAHTKSHGTTQATKVGGVDRLTDVKSFTGSHKERFDETGKGKGKEGRADVVDNTGYVGNYKGAGTYDKK